ncbi:acetyl-CoA carboxylase biotin carboxylase subunit [Lentimicrobium sp.]|jgi:acetyl-CoA carboxylase biotin carboxylase subunit|uniref:acetyl-CoA carboxylase biotin carboxylase subunit n=1 Tax=Lentimicrobium sp. TaxID=2034841 RepID=UPI0025E56FE5|nr:acetyl-CoA carboxylase biotin carboxylase subunit [Lentimicrobium sp.]MCO5257003.1 acetyl-CoA carboxylase biotin carboxylase subunit [Lentimicrobium sp.]HPF64592.1 acetyl-CoA carboxylase biotin carboxylase subunit [Lentimicrobium sp.]HPR24806.1 acetyl-CoA carboxylase biotin carboxylase subunit [Lentimicrobium sp.]HRW69342.1 acetyl-CoA carboxylase biotin carboxylase subunit [Lentimicrobium sp.]
MIKKVLVANRGEIAFRIMRSCREMGISTVAVYSEADRAAMHVRYADEAYPIGPAPSAESYLNIDRIIEAARKANADAIHPGYGFLSENAAFSERCSKEGIEFIGPGPDAIRQMGDKITARKTMIAAGVPVVPGTVEMITDYNEALKTIREIGLPVMIKASAGGGGKGMRLVKREEDIESALRGARSEAKTAFGDDAVYIEKYIESPHHIEFQILADKHGNAVHLFERECSVQRRHQKVVEETPSPLLTPEVRAEMGAHAVAAAKACNYRGAGTIEFIVDDQLNYYFLEMNTRLQVEHPITERVVGVDLVKEMINIANGFELPFRQEELKQSGHAIECRIYAEDPDRNFMPSPGTIRHISEPLGLGVRHDGYVYEGYTIPIYYDPMISKLIVWAGNRKEAINRMSRALEEYKITGVKTSIPFLAKIMEAEAFRSGKYNTHFIEENSEFLFGKPDCDGVCEDIALISAYLEYTSRLQQVQLTEKMNKTVSRWKDPQRHAYI